MGEYMGSHGPKGTGPGSGSLENHFAFFSFPICLQADAKEACLSVSFLPCVPAGVYKKYPRS